MWHLTFTAVLLSSAAVWPALADDFGRTMTPAAQRFLAALDDTGRARAQFRFDSPERFNWHWADRDRKGIPFKAMTPGQRILAFGLLSTGLSEAGMLKATAIMSADDRAKAGPTGPGPVRDPEFYFVSVFGTPGDESGWGWRIEGHHLSLNYTLHGNAPISGTPFLLGADPTRAIPGSRKGEHPLGEIEGSANFLLKILSGEQRKAAIISPVAPPATTAPNPVQVPPTAREGISAKTFNGGQIEAIWDIADTYATYFPEWMAKDFFANGSRDLTAIHFAWYGPADTTKPHAFRLRGSRFLIEFNDTKNESDQIYSYYRNPTGDFGLPGIPVAR